MKKHRSGFPPNIHESFSDLALLMLTTFIFLMVVLMLTSKLATENELPKLKRDVKELRKELNTAQKNNKRLLGDMNSMLNMTPTSQMEQALASVGLGKNDRNRKDLDVFIKGLRQLPGKTLHLIIDATGSMHGVTTFLIPVLRVIVIRSGKRLDAITWFSDNRSETYRGTMGDMFDHLLSGAPFIGSDETIGRAFRDAARNAPAPGAYLLMGDEPSTDRVHYFNIPSPVYTLPIGASDPDTNFAYQEIADKTGGKMLHINLK